MPKYSLIENPQVKWKRQVRSVREWVMLEQSDEWKNFFSWEQKVMWWVYSREPEKQKREDSKQTAAVNQFSAASRHEKKKLVEEKKKSFNVFKLDTSWKIGCDLITQERVKKRKENGEWSRRCVGSLEMLTHMVVLCSIPFRSSPQGASEADAALFDLCSAHQRRTPSRPRLLVHAMHFLSD